MNHDNLKLLKIDDVNEWYDEMRVSGVIGFTSVDTHTCYYVGSDGFFCLGGFLAEVNSKRLKSTLKTLQSIHSHFYIVVKNDS